MKKISKNNIEFLGWQSDKNVKLMFSQCKAFVFPGEEDFGITPVEAMAAVKPVVAQNIGGVKETVVDNKTGILFDKCEVKDIVDAISELEKNYDKFDPLKIQKRASDFSEERFKTSFKKTVIYNYQKHLTKLDER